MSQLRLPRGYLLEECDADLLFLRRPDGSEAAVFSARGATREAIEAAAQADFARCARLAEKERDLPPWSGTAPSRCSTFPT